MGYFSWYPIFKESYSKKRVKESLIVLTSFGLDGDGHIELQAMTGELWWLDQVEVLHPYFGFSRDPDRNIGISKQGFPSYDTDQLNPDDKKDVFRVAVFGGSFAKEVFFLTIEQIKGFFKQYHANVEIVNCSIGGYKQPQQLMVLNYLLATGVDIDVVINIDGFNEVAIPYVENLQHGVSPFYPRNWITRAKNLNDPDEIRGIGKVEVLKGFRVSMARRIQQMKLYRSPTLSLIWQLMDNRVKLHIAHATLKVNAIDARGAGFYVQGPPYSFQRESDLYQDLADLWMNSSLMMHAICQAKGIGYYHFLQPNQYFPDSKIISYEERIMAYDLHHPYRDGVLKGYPYLRSQGRILIDKGVRFRDLTDIFKNNSDTLYKDTCCHLNEIGYGIFVSKMFEYMAGFMESRP
ncbi:MAG: hypothetical protein HQK66_08040 [Desulfamplus sp.]|nr:hypothetical protein [Desulfamplus sp.]